MKFRYIGENSSLMMFGVKFVGDKPMEVTDERAIGKLSNNSHFKAVKPRGSKDGNESGSAGQSRSTVGNQASGSKLI